MFPTFSQTRAHLRAVIKDKTRQGHVTKGLLERLEAIPDSYDALHGFGVRLADLPIRDDWPYVEPNDLEGILAECDSARPLGAVRPLDPVHAARRVEAAFLGSVCGCVLGKPIEIDPTLAEIRGALEPSGEWPLRDYVTERAAHNFGRGPHPDWPESVRENIRFVAPDDDINYTILGMLLLERHGASFDRKDVLEVWMGHLPPGFTWGPERTTLAKATLDSLPFGETKPDDATLETWVTTFNPHDEFCGAMIRADAYGYACAGNPALAAELAWRDARLTHRRTGLYGTMFAAAAIATAFVARTPLEIFETALQFVPKRSRFYQIVADSLNEVSTSGDWLEGYGRIHGKYRQYSHCHVYQETGTLINTLRFATSVGDGICKQVMQGNDTDSFGATAGSILGAFFGPGHLEARWFEPFGDEIRTKLAGFPERSLSALAARMARLPGILAQTARAEVVGPEVVMSPGVG